MANYYSKIVVAFNFPKVRYKHFWSGPFHRWTYALVNYYSKI